MPICQDAVYTFPDLSSLIAADKYDGNSSSHAWTIDQGTPQVTNNEIALILTETNNGTRISSTKYVHYGTITATAKASKWSGVVTAFITMSNVKDEIDWEWPGTKTTEVQSNFFFQGNVDCTSVHSLWGYNRHLTSM
jgi:beta-glucanase (GH16 family)